MTCLRSAIIFVFDKPHDESLHARNWGESHDVSIVEMDGIPRTAGAHSSSSLTRKELTSKVKTSRDARLADIPADTVDNPRVGWIA